MNIAIKADGGKNIGLGHIMRTLVLANILSKYHNVFYICKSGEEFELGRKKIKESGYIINSNIEIYGDILITDSYDVDDKYFLTARTYYKHLVYIDDLNLFYHPVDLVINQNINADELNYTEPHLLLGTKYSLLREEFKNCPPKLIKDKVTDVLITMGGADPHSLTIKLLEELNQLSFNFHVVIGQAFRNKEAIFKSKYNNVTFYENANMKSLMYYCDIAISASGSTLYELLACGVPSLGIVVAENQKNVAEKFNRLGLIKNLGVYSSVAWDSIRDKLIYLSDNIDYRKKISAEMQQIVDGLGGKRITDYINTNFVNY
ncbi:MAG: UDP-2,4-diacetamido-2,4, 6-trideoxy-beta-L-altropyranose hydrolase [Clostridiales bacterium]|nr:UDP-2,4-diacetamido-2,4, 6-trideoxy-beta-L-altropyranose hydrolase [Clostridiales bacterium]